MVGICPSRMLRRPQQLLLDLIHRVTPPARRRARTHPIATMKKFNSLRQLRSRFGLQKCRTIMASMARRVDPAPSSSFPGGSVLRHPQRAHNLLCDLPADVLFLVLYELDADSLLRCKQVGQNVLYL